MICVMNIHLMCLIYSLYGNAKLSGVNGPPINLSSSKVMFINVRAVCTPSSASVFP